MQSYNLLNLIALFSVYSVVPNQFSGVFIKKFTLKQEKEIHYALVQ